MKSQVSKRKRFEERVLDNGSIVTTVFGEHGAEVVDVIYPVRFPSSLPPAKCGGGLAPVILDDENLPAARFDKELSGDRPLCVVSFSWRDNGPDAVQGAGPVSVVSHCQRENGPDVIRSGL